MILAGDIGGTKVNLALFDSATRITEKRYESRDFSGIEKILDDFLKDNDSTIEKVCFGVAGRIINEKCSLTNLSWQVEVECLKKHLGIDAVWLINDLAATACAIPFLSPEDLEIIQTGASVSEGRISVVSVGTGLGQAFLIPERKGKLIFLPGTGWRRSFYFFCKKSIQGSA